MSRKRYIKDYRLLRSVDEKGRIHSSYEYIGKPYRFAAPPEQLARDKRRALLLCLPAWLLLIGAMVPRSFGMQTFYVALPFVFAALPLGIATDILLGLLPAREPLEHRQADRINNRFPASMLAALVLSGGSLLGQLLRVILGGGMLTGDWVFFLCAALLVGDCVLLFGLRGRLTVREG